MANDNNSDDRGIESERPNVSALASAVISSLNDRSEVAMQSIRAGVVRKLVKATLRDGAFNAEMLLRDLQDQRVVPDQIVDIYIPAAARELGVMWCDDAIGFAKVTIAAARLQGLLTVLAPPWSARTSDTGDTANILLILQANDTHTLGPHVATAQLRRLGASVRLLFGPDSQTVTQLLNEEHYDLVMFSCSRTDSLATIAKMVKRIKTELSAIPPIVLGGLVLNLTDRVKDKTGVDMVTDDVKVAFKLSDKKRRKQRSVAR